MNLDTPTHTYGGAPVQPGMEISYVVDTADGQLAFQPLVVMPQLVPTARPNFIAFHIHLARDVTQGVNELTGDPLVDDDGDPVYTGVLDFTLPTSLN